MVQWAHERKEKNQIGGTNMLFEDAQVLRDTLSPIIDEAMMEDQLREFKPSELKAEYELWQEVHGKILKGYDTCNAKDGTFKKLMAINEEIEEYMDFVDERMKINARLLSSAPSVDGTKDSEEAVEVLTEAIETESEEILSNVVEIENDVKSETPAETEEFDIDSFEIEFDTNLKSREKKAKRKKITIAEKESKKNSETAVNVKKILEEVKERDEKRSKRKSKKKSTPRSANPTDYTSDFEDYQDKRVVADREDGDVKGKWYQVSFRLKTFKKPHFQEFAMGCLDYLKGIVSGVGIYISYYAEALIMSDYENRRWFLDKRHLENLKRFIHFGEWYLDGGVEMDDHEEYNIRKSFHFLKCDTDFKKREIIQDYKDIVEFIEKKDLRRFIREDAEMRSQNTRENLDEILDGVDEKHDKIA